ncbi:hypothetical protein [Taylorella equigenitalis]|uniref:hypothetical protein n=1 Tax=Taylorella equigenitalis TaxID=29575 RepID=UPI0005D24F6C|nr:hypothetical protein [Taylorella equigenitalis]
MWVKDLSKYNKKALTPPATVHEHHALVIVNNGGATASDILELSDAIKNDVFNKFGIMLEPEPRII